MLNRLFLLLFLLLLVPSSRAEKADRDKPINIDADKAEVDNAKQTSTFIGNVVVTQGTMVIRGDKMVVTQDKDGYKHGTAYGNPASYRQKREGLNEYVEGYGDRIVYDTRADTVDFYEHAKVKRGNDEVRGEHVTYNSNTEIFQANDQGSTGAPQRVHAVLYPKPKPASGVSAEPVTEKK